jgi:hypothetical protein
MTNEERAAQAVAEVEAVAGTLPVEYEGTQLVARHAASVGEVFVAKLDQHWRLAKMLVASGLLPTAIKRPEQAIAIMLKGQELALPPMQAFASIHIIEGKPSLAASLMVALCVRDAGCVFTTERKDAEGATVKIERPGWAPYTGTFTREMAARVKYHTRSGLKPLLEKDNWRNYPEAMYWSRAASDACRTVCPDILAGMYTPEELMPAARVDEQGAVIAPEVEAELADSRATELRARIADQRHGMDPTATGSPTEEATAEPDPEPDAVLSPGMAAVAEEIGLTQPGPGPAVLDVVGADGERLPDGYTVVNTSPGWYQPCYDNFPLTERKYHTVAEAAGVCAAHAAEAASAQADEDAAVDGEITDLFDN